VIAITSRLILHAPSRFRVNRALLRRDKPVNGPLQPRRGH
jgi:hypothetical protein